MRAYGGHWAHGLRKGGGRGQCPFHCRATCPIQCPLLVLRVVGTWPLCVCVCVCIDLSLISGQGCPQGCTVTQKGASTVPCCLQGARVGTFCVCVCVCVCVSDFYIPHIVSVLEGNLSLLASVTPETPREGDRDGRRAV